LIRLAVLDVDGTLKQAESPYQYLHERLGIEHLAAEHRDLALAGHISYGEWLFRDVALWTGQPVDRLAAWLAQNPYVPGAADFVAGLKAAGVVIALVSAGFTLNTDPVAAELGVDYVLANELGVTDGRLDGSALNHVPEGGKAAFVRNLMARLDVSQDETLAAGDTRGDLELFACAGLRIAVNPKSAELRAAADVVFERDLTAALAWLYEHGYLPAAPFDRLPGSNGGNA
jgi:phosphoserine phosphatase